MYAKWNETFAFRFDRLLSVSIVIITDGEPRNENSLSASLLCQFPESRWREREHRHCIFFYFFSKCIFVMHKFTPFCSRTHFFHSFHFSVLEYTGKDEINESKTNFSCITIGHLVSPELTKAKKNKKHFPNENWLLLNLICVSSHAFRIFCEIFLRSYVCFFLFRLIACGLLLITSFPTVSIQCVCRTIIISNFEQIDGRIFMWWMNAWCDRPSKHSSK